MANQNLIGSVYSIDSDGSNIYAVSTGGYLGKTDVNLSTPFTGANNANISGVIGSPYLVSYANNQLMIAGGAANTGNFSFAAYNASNLTQFPNAFVDVGPGYAVGIYPNAPGSVTIAGTTNKPASSNYDFYTAQYCFATPIAFTSAAPAICPGTTATLAVAPTSTMTVSNPANYKWSPTNNIKFK